MRPSGWMWAAIVVSAIWMIAATFQKDVVVKEAAAALADDQRALCEQGYRRSTNDFPEYDRSRILECGLVWKKHFEDRLDRYRIFDSALIPFVALLLAWTFGGLIYLFTRRRPFASRHRFIRNSLGKGYYVRPIVGAFSLVGALALVGAVLLIGVAWLAERQQTREAAPFIIEEVDKVPKFDVGLVLGTSPLLGDGLLELRERLLELRVDQRGGPADRWASTLP